jgi:hypothetical protein
MYSTRIFSGVGIQTHAGFLAMMLSFTAIMPPVIPTLTPPSVVSPWFALVRVVGCLLWLVLLFCAWSRVAS